MNLALSFYRQGNRVQKGGRCSAHCGEILMGKVLTQERCHRPADESGAIISELSRSNGSQWPPLLCLGGSPGTMFYSRGPQGWSPDQQHQPHLGTCKNDKSVAPLWACAIRVSAEGPRKLWLNEASRWCECTLVFEKPWTKIKRRCWVKEYKGQYKLMAQTDSYH